MPEHEHIDDPQYFDPTAPEGQPVRYLHDGCSKRGDRTLSVTRTASGWKYKCHRCGARGFRGLNGQPASVVMKFLQPTDHHPVVTDLKFPEVYPGTVPYNLQVSVDSWLEKYGITSYEYRRGGLYIGANRRLIFPVWNHAKVPVYWQGRSFEKNQPKWINQRMISRDQLVYAVEQEPATEDLVIVEDMVSAIKVHRVMDSVALLGSYTPDWLIMDLSKEYKAIHLWLDSDKASYTLEKTKRFQSFGYNVKRIYTPRDPKWYSEPQILEIIQQGGVASDNKLTT